MSKLLPVFLIGVILAFASDRMALVSYDSYGDRVYQKKEKFIYIILAIILAVFVGLRTAYNDTETYSQMYNALLPGISNVLNIDFSLGENPGFWVVNIILKSLSFTSQDFLMFYALVTNFVYLWFIRKYSDNIWLSVFLFFTMGCYTFTMAAIKQCVAVAFCLIATDRYLQNKKFPFIFWVLIASTFHPYSLMYLIMPLLSFKPWSGKTYLFLLIFLIIGLSLQPLLGTVVDITTMLGEEYDATTFTGEGINIFRLAVVWVPVVISFFTRRYLRANNSKADNIILNLTILNAEIMFIGLFGTANYFGRLANYFLIFQALCLPHLFKSFNTKSKTIITICCVLCFLLYFYYANVINQNFDSMFNYVPFVSYIKSVIGSLLL